MSKIYKIAARQFFRKYIKKTKTYEDYTSFEFIKLKFDTREEAEKYLEDRVSNTHLDFGNHVYHYEKIAENIYKLTWKDCKNFYILSYQICEFITEEEFV